MACLQTFLPSLALALVALPMAAQATSLSPTSAVEGLRPERKEIGTVESVIREFTAQHADSNHKIPHLVRLATGADLGVKITHFFHQDGVISISGTATESDNSTFVLKGNVHALRGFLVRHDLGRAFEYTTDDNGRVSITEVPISKIYPDLDKAWEKATTFQVTAQVVAPTYSDMALRQAPHIGPYNNEDVTKLESKPGSAWVFFLDNREVMSGSTPLNGVTKENMYRMWQTVSAIYSPYKLNITTNPTVYEAAKAANVTRTGIIHFYNQDGRSNAPIGAFGTTSAGTLYRNPSSGFDYGYGIGMTAAHEVGHEMGMQHDHGGTGGEYFEGIPAYQWGPIMGNYWMGGDWTNGIWTWSKGEYATATNFEDDLRIMNVTEGVPYVDDDNVSGKPLTVGPAGDISPLQNYGQIEKTGDTDAFTFTLTSTGSLNLRIDPIEYFGMLDVDAKIYNAANAVVASSNLSVNRRASFSNVSLPAGSYRLVIAGGAEGTPSNGFSNYSSLGWYAMKGTLTGVGASAPSITQQPQSSTVAVGTSATFSVSAAGSTPLSYQWLRNSTAIPGATSATYTTPATVLTDSGASFAVTVSNSLGSVTSSAATLTVTTGGSTELIKNGTFEGATTSWTQTAQCITNSTSNAAYQGAYYAWLGGNGTTSTEEVSQAVTLPASGTVTFSFYLKVATAETDNVAYDTLKVRVLDASTGAVLGTLATYSNLNKSTAYAKKTFDLAAYRGKTIKVDFLMSEDASLQTTFLVDNVSVIAQ